MERSYIAFISYKHTKRDSAIAKKIHTLIENYVIPKSLRNGSKKLGVVFRDEEELPISSDLSESICAALDASKYLIVICSTETKESPWVAREINYFLQHHDAANAFVVLVDGEPKDVFPYALTHVLDKESGEYQEVEPLAMDVRADSLAASLKKTQTYIKKLYSGMLGCSYDSLVQRERTRRMKRLAALVMIIALLVSCFVGILFVKNRQLSQKNDELTAAIDLALMRESELLVAEAEEDIENADTAAAIRNASDALYTEDIDRPYYAPAERVLFSALDIWQERHVEPLLSKVFLNHGTPIEMMTYGANGSTVCMIDTYGTVSCFDAAKGDLLWSVRLRDNEEDITFKAHPQIWYSEESDIIACYFNNIISGLDASTGKLIWQTKFEGEIVGGLFFHAQEQKLAYIERVYALDSENPMESLYKYNFVVFSTQDGSMLHKTALDRLTEKSMKLDLNRFGQININSSGGIFADPDHFVGAAFEREDDITKALLYMIDLSEDTVTYIENDTYSDNLEYMQIACVGNERVLVLSCKSDKDMQTGYIEKDLWMQCFDMQSGSLLWENAARSDTLLSMNSDCFVIPRNEEIVIGAGHDIFVVDSDSGMVLTSMQFGARIIDMYPVVGDVFAYMLEGGQCALGWNSREEIYDSSYLNGTVSLPATSDSIAYKGGLIRPVFDGDTFGGFNVTPQKDGGGSITYLSEDGYNAYVAAGLSKPVLPDSVAVEMKNPESKSMGDFIDADLQGNVLLGLMRLEEGYGLMVVDTENHSADMMKVWDNLPYLDYSLYLIGDGSSILMCTENGDIRVFGLDGSVSVLVEQDAKAELFKADAARLASDGRVFSSRSDGQKLFFRFEDGKEVSVSLPEEICWAVPDVQENLSMLHAGENALVILSDFISEDAKEIEHFAVYDLIGGKWKMVPDAANGSHDRVIAFAEKSPLFAVYDADMNIRIYNGKTAKPMQCINVGLPVKSVVKIGMLADDQYVYVLAKDGQLIVYDFATREIVFRAVFEYTAMGESFFNWFDREHDRLYICDGSKALCVDLSSWKQLFGVGSFKFYSPMQNEVYRYTYDMETSDMVLKAMKIPNTSELIAIAQEIFD